MQYVRYSCRILVKFEVQKQIFENSPMLNLIKIYPVAAELFQAKNQTYERTDKHNEVNNRLSHKNTHTHKKKRKSTLCGKGKMSSSSTYENSSTGPNVPYCLYML
jgi:ABC-type sulfate transport system substrate-binding protein